MKKILIADDVKGWRDFHAGIMRELFGGDIEIVAAESAKSAYDILLAGADFDIIATDLQMEEDFYPKTAGEWLIEEIRTFSRYNNTKIIIISASPRVQSIAELAGVSCIPKQKALDDIFAYKDILGIV